MQYIDLHSHILPGLDDGSTDMTCSMDMLDGLAQLGFSTICATPHQKTGQYLPSLADITVAHEQVKKEIARRNWPIQIPLAAENMWDSTLYERIVSDEIPSYDNGKAFLLEFVPNLLPADILEHTFDLRRRGKLPVIAHPERYTPLWNSPALTHRLAVDCAMVVDLGAVAGANGRKQAQHSRKMILDGTAHAAASDAHSPNDITSIQKGITWIHKNAGTKAVDRLLAINPEMILAGIHPED